MEANRDEGVDQGENDEHQEPEDHDRPGQDVRELVEVGIDEAGRGGRGDGAVG